MTAPADHDGPHFSWIGEVVCGSDEYAVIRISLDGTIEGWWGAAKRLFGYAPSEAVGQPFAMLFTAADREKGLHEVELELARQAGRSEDDRWHLRKDGARFWGNGVVNPVHDAHGRHIAYSKLMRDRTDLRIRYEALQNRLHHLAEQMTRGQEALGTLVHELRNPLAPMVNAARVIESDAAGEDIKRRMIRVVARQAEVMRQVLDEAGRNPTANSEPLHVQSVVLQEALRTSVDALLFDAGAKGVDLALVCPATPVSIEVDPARLQQMLMNLLTNAIKYTDPGGRIHVESRADADHVLVRVSDNGTGIGVELLPHIFDLFVQSKRTLDRAQGGLGIGLSVVKRLVEMHGGTVAAESDGPGQGATFSIRLPRLAHASSSVGPPAAIPVAVRRVLIIDDNRDAAESLAMLMSLEGHQVATVFAAEDALARVTALRPEVVLLDIGLPGMDGYEVARRIRGMPGGDAIRLVALTGYGQVEDRRRAMSAGFDDHLVKPVEPERLQAALRAS